MRLLWQFKQRFMAAGDTYLLTIRAAFVSAACLRLNLWRAGVGDCRSNYLYRAGRWRVTFMDYEGNIFKQKIIRFRNKMEKYGAIIV